MPSFGGLRVVSSIHATVRVLNARSPARARRREKKGHPQRYREQPTAFIMGGRILVAHPEIVAELQRRTALEGK